MSGKWTGSRATSSSVPGPADGDGPLQTGTLKGPGGTDRVVEDDGTPSLSPLDPTRARERTLPSSLVFRFSPSPFGFLTSPPKTHLKGRPSSVSLHRCSITRHVGLREAGWNHRSSISLPPDFGMVKVQTDKSPTKPKGMFWSISSESFSGWTRVGLVWTPSAQIFNTPLAPQSSLRFRGFPGLDSSRSLHSWGGEGQRTPRGGDTRDNKFHSGARSSSPWWNLERVLRLGVWRD